MNEKNNVTPPDSGGVTDTMIEAGLEAHASGQPFESPFGEKGSFAVIYRAMRHASPDIHTSLSEGEVALSPSAEPVADEIALRVKLRKALINGRCATRDETVISDSTDRILDVLVAALYASPVSDASREALKLARKRIEYFGTITDDRHREANEQYFFPPIDAALSPSFGKTGGGKCS